MLNTFSKILLLLLLPAQACFAQLVPINESELSGMTGQAFIAIDQSNSGGLDFTKVTLGLDIATSLNADLLDIGNYNNGSDIKISDFGLGRIDSSGDIVPFKIKDPFIELAYDKSSGSQNLVGIRLGFGGAQGKLSGDISSLSGSIDVRVEGSAKPIRDSNWLAWLTMSNNDILAADAVLVKGPNESNTGSRSDYRATWVGVPNNTKMNCVSSGCSLGASLASVLTVNNCALLGIATCFELKNFKSLDIGNENTNTYAEGLFLSFQTQTVNWVDGSNSTPAGTGAFMNIPDGGIQVNFEQALNGTDRVRTRYVDPYFD